MRQDYLNYIRETSLAFVERNDGNVDTKLINKELMTFNQFMKHKKKVRKNG